VEACSDFVSSGDMAVFSILLDRCGVFDARSDGDYVEEERLELGEKLSNNVPLWLAEPKAHIWAYAEAVNLGYRTRKKDLEVGAWF